MARRRNHTKLVIGVIVFLLVGVGVFFGVQWWTKTGIFKIPGVVYYDESLNDDERVMLEEIFTDEVELDKDVTISAKYSLEKPAEQEGEYIYNIYVPTTDFYSLDTNVEAGEPELLFADAYESEVAFTMTPLEELDHTRKLLSINDKYYLDEFDTGAVFRIIKFASDEYDREIRPLVETKLSKIWPDQSTVLTLAQTGVTALSRGMNAKLRAVGGNAEYFAEKIRDFLTGFDITHTSNEASFTEFASDDNICSNPKFIDTLKTIGLDVVELTGNHNQDCGDEAARNTIDMYNEAGIKIVGGGKTAEEAAKPLTLTEKGTGVTLLGYNLSTGGATLDDTPGANQYDEENIVSEIGAAKERGDLVIVDIQYYECSAYASEYEDTTCDAADSAAGDQVGFFRHLIDLGADVVVGTSAHQPQTYEEYGDGVIYYGLGNLFFDQVWWPGTTRSLILAHYFYNGKLLQTRIVPTVYDKAMQVELMEEADAKWFLGRLIKAKP